ncbi:hypothetical protein cyc_04443 [Cyclospora cayetanensis]|uniref:Uncharacterized protein n=1 Tax=Cyclospora cayetanensis TaxID=88456 RepID=A0A1D3CR73_9EIME|nr:hypothetical protein cyc_04443 [Cyclospora cayetanensis]
MEKNDCAENQRWRAIHGKRTEELLRQPEEVRLNTLQPRGKGADIRRGPAAGLQTDWGHDAVKSSFRRSQPHVSSQVADRLLGRIDDEVGAVPTSKRLELFQRRNSSTRIQDIINWTDRTQEEPGVLNVSGERGLSLDSANFRKGDPVGGTQHRLSQVHTTENPCRWGVDVLNYQLPEPRKPRGLVNEESLGTGLIPKWNFDDPLCPRRKTTSVMCQVSCRGHLEPSTLCPTENASQKFAQGKKKSEMQGDSLDGSLVPFDEPEFSRKRCYKQWHMCSLQGDLTPHHFNQDQATRPQPGSLRSSLQSGSLMPL